MTLAGLISWLGLFLPLSYVVTQAIHAGMDHTLATYLVPIIQAAKYVIDLSISGEQRLTHT